MNASVFYMQLTCCTWRSCLLPLCFQSCEPASLHRCGTVGSLSSDSSLALSLSLFCMITTLVFSIIPPPPLPSIAVDPTSAKLYLHAVVSWAVIGWFGESFSPGSGAVHTREAHWVRWSTGFKGPVAGVGVELRSEPYTFCLFTRTLDHKAWVAPGPTWLGLIKL